MRTSRLCLIVAAILTACSDPSTSGRAPVDARQKFVDGTWTLSVDRAFRVGSVPVESPGAPLPDAGYSPVSARVDYLMFVYDNAARIEVRTPSMVARLTQSSADQLIYNVETGAFAGGRIVVSKGSGDVLQGELTIYGSGVPVAKSERGAVRQIVALAN